MPPSQSPSARHCTHFCVAPSQSGAEPLHDPHVAVPPSLSANRSSPAFAQLTVTIAAKNPMPSKERPKRIGCRLPLTIVVRPVAALLIVVVASCGSSGPRPPAGLVIAPMMDPDASLLTSPDIGDAGGVTHALGGDPSIEQGPRLCGCGLCEPIVSQDRCSSDANCRPATPCHATACASLQHSVARTPGTMCTQEMQCATSDANTCGCVKGLCTLYKR